MIKCLHELKLIPKYNDINLERMFMLFQLRDQKDHKCSTKVTLSILTFDTQNSTIEELRQSFQGNINHDEIEDLDTDDSDIDIDSTNISHAVRADSKKKRKKSRDIIASKINISYPKSDMIFTSSKESCEDTEKQQSSDIQAITNLNDQEEIAKQLLSLAKMFIDNDYNDNNILNINDLHHFYNISITLNECNNELKHGIINCLLNSYNKNKLNYFGVLGQSNDKNLCLLLTIDNFYDNKLSYDISGAKVIIEGKNEQNAINSYFNNFLSKIKQLADIFFNFSNDINLLRENLMKYLKKLPLKLFINQNKSEPLKAQITGDGLCMLRLLYAFENRKVNFSNELNEGTMQDCDSTKYNNDNLKQYEPNLMVEDGYKHFFQWLNARMEIIQNIITCYKDFTKVNINVDVTYGN